jgi:hypothetical protein
MLVRPSPLLALFAAVAPQAAMAELLPTSFLNPDPRNP